MRLQARLPGASGHHSCFAARSRANAFSHDKPAQQERLTKSKNIREASTPHSRPHTSGAASSATVFSRFVCETELLLQSAAHFADLIFQKCPGALSLLAFFEAQIELSLCAFRQQLLQVEPRTRGNRDPHITTKNTRFRARDCFHPWIDTLPNHYTVTIPNYLMRGGWHDDAVDMMMRLTLYWECQPCESSVTWKFSRSSLYKTVMYTNNIDLSIYLSIYPSIHPSIYHYL